MARRLLGTVRATRRTLVVVIVCAAMAVIGVAGLGVSLYLKAQSTTDNCEAIRENNQILRELVVHARNLSLQSIEAGTTEGLTATEVRDFYNPTIARIDEVTC